MIAIQTANLTKCYKNIIAVNNLNLEIRKGELFALLGVNGACQGSRCGAGEQ